MIAEFTIQGRLYGTNELIAAINRHRMVGAKLKKDAQALCGWAVVAQKVPRFNNPVTIHVRWVEPNLRRDLDNICGGIKPILDSLVELERLPNDTRQWVKGISHEFPEPDKENPRVEVRLTEVHICSKIVTGETRQFLG